jgi:hypothetical protein
MYSRGPGYHQKKKTLEVKKDTGRKLPAPHSGCRATTIGCRDAVICQLFTFT